MVRAHECWCDAGRGGEGGEAGGHRPHSEALPCPALPLQVAKSFLEGHEPLHLLPDDYEKTLKVRRGGTPLSTQGMGGHPPEHSR